MARLRAGRLVACELGSEAAMVLTALLAQLVALAAAALALTACATDPPSQRDDPPAS